MNTATSLLLRLILTASALAFNSAQGEVKTKDLVINLQSGKPSSYQVAFCYRRMSVPDQEIGHAFLAIGKWSGTEVEIQGYGFYPEKDSFVGSIIGPGEVRFPPKDAVIVKRTDFLFQEKPSETALPKGSCRVLKHITKEKFEELQKLFSKWNDEKYFLVGKNCVTMMDSAAASVGLKIPGKTFLLPKSYVEELWRLNGGIELPAPP